MKRVTGYIAIVPLAVTVLGFSGWVFDVDILKRVTPTTVGINPLTLTGILLCTVSFLLIFAEPKFKQARMAGLGLGAVVFILGVIRLLPAFGGFDLRFDEYMFSGEMHREELAGRLNRMANNTGLTFILLGLALVFSAGKRHILRSAANIIAAGALTIGLFVFIGYLYHVKEHYGIVNYVPMAPQTSISIICLALMLLIENRHYGFVRTLSSDYLGSDVAQRLMPGIIVAPIVLGFMRLYMAWHYPVSLELGVSALVTAIIVVFLLVQWFMSRTLNISDARRRKLEAQLEREAQLVNIMPDAVIYGDNAHRITYMNPAAERMFESPAAKALGQKADDVFKVETKNVTREMMGAALMSEKGYWRGEAVITTHSGKNINVLIGLKAVKNEDGKNDGWMGVYTDITQQRATQERLEFALDGMEAGLWEWNIANEEQSWMSPRYKQLLGYDEHELKATLEGLRMLIHPDEVKQILKYFQQMARAATPIEAEARYRMKDGSYRWFSINAKTKLDANGQPLTMIGSIIDIDERKRAQALVQQQADLIGMMPDGVVYGDMQNRILNMNGRAEEMIEVSLAEAKGKTIDDLVQVKIIGRSREANRKEFMEKGFIRQEMELRTASGKTVVVLATVKRYDELLGQGPGWICIYTDISPLRMNEDLKTANRYMEQLAFISSHDIKSPIISLNGLIDMLRKSKNLQADDLQILDLQKRLIEQMQRTNKGLNDILQLRRKLQSRDENAVETAPLSDLLQNVKSLLAFQIQESGAVINIDMDGLGNEQLPKVDMQSVFYNLFDNAIKYRDKNRALVVNFSARRQNNELHFTIEDNGLGFDSSSNKGKVFGIFKRFHTHAEGTGVGLHIVKSIIESYKGRIEVDSKPGAGTRFEITFNDLIN